MAVVLLAGVCVLMAANSESPDGELGSVSGAPVQPLSASKHPAKAAAPAVLRLLFIWFISTHQTGSLDALGEIPLKHNIKEQGQQNEE